MADRDELQALRRLAELEAKASGHPTPSMRRGEDRQLKVDPNLNPHFPAGHAALIASGRTMDKVAEGNRQLGLNAAIAGKEAMGLPTAEEFAKLQQQAATEQFKDEAYAPLREKHPLATGTGEAIPTMATPMGQAGVVGRVLAPALGFGALGAAEYGTPQERAMKGGANLVAGLGGGAVGELVRAGISPARSSLTAPMQRAVHEAAEKMGYVPRASELTGNETLRRLEDTVARQPGGAGVMREFADQNDRSVSRHLAKGLGEDADALTSDVFARASERRGDAYDALRDKAKMPVIQPIFDAVERSQKLLTKGDPTGPKKEAFDALERLKDQLYGTKEFDGATYQAWTSDLASQARTLGKTNRTAAAALQQVEKAMDAVARGKDAPKWLKLDKEHATQELLMKPGMVNEQTGKASTARIASQVERQYGKSLKTGKMQGEVFDVAALGRALPKMQEGSQTAGREAFGSPMSWLLAGPNYAAAKGLTSELGRDYLSRGLLGHPGMSRGAGGLLGRSAIPLSIAEIEALLLGYQ